jgi:hypothetical protein
MILIEELPEKEKDNYILMLLLLTAFIIFVIFIITITIYTQNSFRLACINNNGELYVSN